MRAAFWVSLVAIGAVGLAGCSPERATEAVTERAVVATYAAGENIPEQSVFTADVSGDTSVEMPPGNIEYRVAPEMALGSGTVEAHRLLVMSAERDGRLLELTLEFAPDLEADTYDIAGGAYDPMRAPVSAELVDYPVDGGRTAEDAIHYNNGVDGSLTFDRVGDRVTGSFEFTAEATHTVDGTESVLSVTTAGTFDDIELVEAEHDWGGPTAEATEAE